MPEEQPLFYRAIFPAFCTGNCPQKLGVFFGAHHTITKGGKMSPRSTRCDFGRGGILCVGAGTRTRTGDLLITSQLLYQLSYAGPQKML